jgi:hypothetical protein
MSRFPETIQANLPAGVSALVGAAARSQHSTTSHYVRSAVMHRLNLDGFSTAPTAGELYDLVDGKRRWARVIGDHIDASYEDGQPEGFLPVVHVDSQPFNPLLHYRHTPSFKVEAGRVVCTYPIRLKTSE